MTTKRHPSHILITTFAALLLHLPVLAEKALDAVSLRDTGVIRLTGFSAKPVKGELTRQAITLPEYDRVLYFSTDGRNRFLSAANRLFPWAADSLADLMKPGFKPDEKASEPARQGLLALFHLKDGGYLLLQGVCGPETMSVLEVADDGRLDVKLMNFGAAPVDGDFPLLAWSRGADIYKVFHDGAVEILNTEPVKGRAALRHTKRYPEMFEYLGWCSWEQYRRNINSDLLVDSMKAIEKSEVPVRWVLVDDGHQDQTGTGMSDSRMLSFEAHPENFPNGFKPLMDLRSDKIKWLGIWHAMNGQWQGLNPDHRLDELRPYLTQINKKSGGKPFPVMMPKGDKESSKKFYDALIGSSKRHGFDFVKIDNQNRQIGFYRNKDNPVETVANHAEALEEAAENLSGGLINCFCGDLLSVYNTKYSAISRVSVDYLLGNEAKAKSHLYQSYQNTLWMGQLVWPDHDMFHSCDPVSGRMMAVSKAVSGAPVYVSDSVKDFVPDLIWPLCYKDGKLLRPLAPAVPLPDSAMLSALEERKAYRVIAPLPNGAAAVIAYSLAKMPAGASVKTRVTPEDYTHAGSFIQPTVAPWKIPAEGLVYYDWYSGKGGKLSDAFDIELKGFSDRYVQLSPVVDGWSVVGRPDKYLSAAAIESIDYAPATLKLRFVESGPLVVYSAAKPACETAAGITDLGDGLWRLDFEAGKPGLEVTLNR